MPLSTSEKIKVLCKRNNMTVVKLAEMLNMSSQNLYNKLKRDNFPEQELINIAKILNCKYESYFILDDGEKL